MLARKMCAVAMDVYTCTDVGVHLHVCIHVHVYIEYAHVQRHLCMTYINSSSQFLRLLDQVDARHELSKSGARAVKG